MVGYHPFQTPVFVLFLYCDPKHSVPWKRVVHMAGNLAFLSGVPVWAAATQRMTLDSLALVAIAFAFLGPTRLWLHPPHPTTYTHTHTQYLGIE